jgi:hypothetical protein
MNPSRSLHLFIFSTLALMAYAFGPLVSRGLGQAPWKIQIPPPGPEEQKLGVLIGKWQNPFHGGKQGLSATEQADGTWEGRWILDGHILTLTATNLPPGKVEKQLDVFGYSARAKLHYMMVITADGQAPAKVEVSWFTIDGNVWHFAPTEEKIGDKIVRHRIAWETKRPDLITSLVESSEDGVHWIQSGRADYRRVADGVTPSVGNLPPASRASTRKDAFEGQWHLIPRGPEMAKLSGWVGRWPNKHQEKGFYVDGAWVSELIADGYFLGMFETNVFVYDSGKKESQKEVDVWGYSDTANLYFRFDVVTYYENSVRTPEVVESYWWFARGNAVILAAPLDQQKIDDKVVTSRFGIALESPDVMTIFEQDLEDGVHWTAPKVVITKTRIR